MVFNVASVMHKFSGKISVLIFDVIELKWP